MVCWPVVSTLLVCSRALQEIGGNQISNSLQCRLNGSQDRSLLPYQCGQHGGHYYQEKTAITAATNALARLDDSQRWLYAAVSIHCLSDSVPSPVTPAAQCFDKTLILLISHQTEMHRFFIKGRHRMDTFTAIHWRLMRCALRTHGSQLFLSKHLNSCLLLSIRYKIRWLYVFIDSNLITSQSVGTTIHILTHPSPS